MTDKVSENKVSENKVSKKASREIKPPEEYPVDAAHPPAYAITRAILSRFLVPLLGGITVIGAENIPRRGPALLAPNHRAYTDPPYLALVTGRQLHLMAKEELFKIPVLGRYITAMGAFPVRRGTADRAALRRAIEELKAGHLVGIFPEGKRSNAGTISPAEKGFALVARQSGVPIIPVALEGTERVHPMHSKILHRARVTARIGAPITAQEMLDAYTGSEKDPLTIIGEATMRAIADLMTEPVTLLKPLATQQETPETVEPGTKEAAIQSREP